MSFDFVSHKKFKVGLAAGSLVLGAGIGWAVLQSRYMPVISDGVFVGSVDVSAMSPAKARVALASYWDKTRNKPVEFESDKRLSGTPSITPDSIGVSADIDQTVASLPLDTFGDRVLRTVGFKHTRLHDVDLKLNVPPSALDGLASEIAKVTPDPSPAKAYLDGDLVKTEPEHARLKLDRDKAPAALATAVLTGLQFQPPLIEGQKQMSDEDLGRITTVIGHFATNFNSGPSRTNNIRLASSMLNGHIVMPGEKFSFNDTLGERTAAKGFQRAGIYLNGHHDFDTGGGICQVSTTLYNTVLQAGLRVVTRQPHSMPVAYVPLGQDATVSYPSLDFAFENNRDFPVAISTKYRDGRIEFSLLGESKTPGDVHIENKLLKNFGTKMETVYNPSLSPGSRRVKEKGSAGRDVASWRVVTLDGQSTRTSLGVSHYAGGPMVVEVGPSKPTAKPVAKPPVSGTLVQFH